MLESVLYISTSRLDPAAAESMVRALIADSVDRNRKRGITGAMIFTGTHFVQILEGSPEAVETMLRALRTDDRHCDMVIIEREPRATRRFSGWSMAYAGPAQFIGRRVNRVLIGASPAELRRAAGWLTNAMQEFVTR